MDLVRFDGIPGHRRTQSHRLPWVHYKLVGRSGLGSNQSEICLCKTININELRYISYTVSWKKFYKSSSFDIRINMLEKISSKVPVGFQMIFNWSVICQCRIIRIDFNKCFAINNLHSDGSNQKKNKKQNKIKKIKEKGSFGDKVLKMGVFWWQSRKIRGHWGKFEIFMWKKFLKI